MEGWIVVVAVVIVVLALALRYLLTRAIVFEYQAGLLYRNGRFDRVLGPGAHWLPRFSTNLARIDLRPRVINVTGQEVASSDGVSLKVSVASRYRVSDPVVAINKVENYEQALYQLIQVSVREVISSATADALLASRKEMGERLLTLCSDAAGAFGLTLEAVNLKDLTFPGELKKIFAQVTQAQKEGQAALERARGETAALRSLANAASLVRDNPALMQLRLLQQLAASSGNTILLGVPPTSSPIPVETRPAEKVSRKRLPEPTAEEQP